MSSAGQCNCQEGNIPLGTCSLPYRACFYFADQDGLDSKTAVYKAFVTAPNGAVSEVDGAASGENAILGAVQALLKSQPAVAAQCGAAEVDDIGDYKAILDQ